MAFQPTRLQRLRESMHEHGLDGLYLRDTNSIRWLTGFESIFDEESAHALFVSDSQCLLHTDSRYSFALRKAAQDSPVQISDEVKGHFSLVLEHIASLQDGSTNTLAKHNGVMNNQSTSNLLTCKRASNVSLGIETSLTLAEFRSMELAISQYQGGVELVETRRLCQALREVKDEEEIATMRKAQAITDAAIDHIINFIRPGMTEREVQRELDRYLFDHGSVGLAFPTIVATGDHAASPHAQPGERRIDQGDAIVMDFGARVNDYCSDMTRTVFVGKPSVEVRRAFKALQCANKACKDMLFPGVIAKDVHNEALRILADYGFENMMGHSLGHSVGIDIHEEPNLSPRNTLPLRSGNVVTVEPGIYKEGSFGMRLEDFGVVSDEGFKVFTQSTHDMVII